MFNMSKHSIEEGSLEKLTCDELLERAEFLEIFDEELDSIMKIIKKKCSPTQVVRLKQIIRVKLLAKDYAVEPEIISRYGTKVAYLINQILDPRVSINVLKRNLEKFMQENGIRDKWGLENLELVDMDGVFKFALCLVDVLSIIGLLEDRDFKNLFAEALIKVAPKLDTYKSLVAIAPILFRLDVSSRDFDLIFKSFGKSFAGLKGASICVGKAIITYLSGGRYLPNLSIILDVLAFSVDDIIRLFEKAKAASPDVVYIVLNQMIYMYFSGNANDVLDDVSRGVIKFDYIAKALLSTSFATISASSLTSLFEFLVNIAGKGLAKIDLYFEILNKIVNETRPHVLRKFLTSERGRELIIKLISYVPEYPIVHTIFRMISIFVPYEYLEELSPMKGSSLLNLDRWEGILTRKVALYLGVTYESA